jgi:hypothetical protein
LFRIACGLCILYTVGSVVVQGMVQAIWLSPAYGGFESLGPAPRLFRLLGGARPETVWLVVVLSLVSGFLLLVGLGGRLTALVALETYLGLWQLNTDACGGYDWLLTNGLWLLVLASSTATLALDCRLRTGRWLSDEPVSAWPRYLAIYQIVVVYWSTGMHKVSGTWTPAGGFSALYYILQEPTWQRWDMSWLAWVYPLTQLGTATTWAWELTAPLLLLVLWYRRTSNRPGGLRALSNRLPLRGFWVAIGLAVHVGILVLMDVGPFSLIALSYYVCLWTPHEWRALAQRLPRRHVDRCGERNHSWPSNQRSSSPA